jgi:outer membrane protein assembly factor BamD (BamD/ComL family)
MKEIFVVMLTTLVLFGGTFPDKACAQNPALQQAMAQYKQENYEEAIAILTEIRQREPESTTAAFFLGLSYKQTMDFASAADHLRAAVVGSPRIKEALIELIEVLYRLPGAENLAEANKWLAVAEQEDIAPAKTAFLAGLIKQREKRYVEAVADFARAKQLDPTTGQSADVQIGLCYVSAQKPRLAAASFRLAIIHDPQSDLAGFARRYQDAVEKRLELEKPFHYTVSFFGQHDTNLVLKPNEATLATGITDETSNTWTTSARVDYTPLLENSWLFNAGYIFSSAWHDNYSSSHDIINNTLTMAPGYNFGDYALNLSASYASALLKSPGYKRYLDYLTIGPLYRRLLNQEQVLEVFAGYTRSEYFQPPLTAAEDRNSDGLSASLSWIWLYKKDGFLNLKYGYSEENVAGDNWRNEGQRFSANLAYPLVNLLAGLKLQVSGQASHQDYDNIHTAFLVKREDRNYVGTIGLNWEWRKAANLVLQYAKTTANSNITIYDYEREQFTAGVEYRF